MIMKIKFLPIMIVAILLCGCGDKEEPYSITYNPPPTTTPGTTTNPGSTTNPGTTTDYSTSTGPSSEWDAALYAYIILDDSTLENNTISKHGDIYKFNHRIALWNESAYNSYEYKLNYKYKGVEKTLCTMTLRHNWTVYIGTNNNEFILYVTQKTGMATSGDILFTAPQTYKYTFKVTDDKLFICNGIPETHKLTFTNNTGSTYKITINNGQEVLTLNKKESDYLILDKSGYHVKCEQQNGYVFYPSVYEYDVFMEKDKTLSVKN